MVEIVEGRSCAGCTLCCKLLEIEELEKPEGKWCPDCAPKSGCRIYDRRPPVCKNFYCLYLISPRLGDHWKPSKSKMIVGTTRLKVMNIYVDDSNHSRWRQRRYFEDIKIWAVDMLNLGGHLMIVEGGDHTLILPNKEINFGPLDAPYEIKLYKSPDGTFDAKLAYITPP